MSYYKINQTFSCQSQKNLNVWLTDAKRGYKIQQF